MNRQPMFPHWNPGTSRKLLVLLLVVAAVIRLAAGWAWQSRLPGRFGMGDSESYWALATSIAEGQPYECGPEHARVFRTPGYPLLLAPILWLAGDDQTAVMLARAEAALLGTLAVAAVWWLTRLLFDDRAALLAAALATFYPGAIALSALILSEAPFCPLMLLHLGLWIAAWQAQNKGRAGLLALAAGLVAGAATLMRPSWLLFTPFAAVVGILLKPIASIRLAVAGTATRTGTRADVPSAAKRPSDIHSLTLRRHLWISSGVILGLAAAMLPWWIRNARVTGRFVPTTLQVGASLYDGLNPDATGGSNMDFVPRFVAQQPQSSSEAQLDRRMRDEALAWAKANPGRVLQLAGVKFLRMWNVWPNEPRLTGWPIRLVVFFTYTPLLIFAIIGAWRTLDRGWPYVVCWLPAVYFTALHTVFVGSIRYREPAMLALLALAAGAGMMMKDEG